MIRMLSLKSETQKRIFPPTGEEEARTEQPAMAPVGEQATDEGRPYQGFVENEARKYWQDLVDVGSLTKPVQQDVRAAALPILGQGLRRRTGNKKYLDPNLALRGVHILIQWALDRGWIKLPYSDSYERLSFVGVLIRQADKFTRQIRKIPLPAHPDPQHPPVYYVMDWKNNRPVPMEDCLLRGDYVYCPRGLRVTRQETICPWTGATDYPLFTRENEAYYTLQFGRDNEFQIIIKKNARRPRERGHYHIKLTSENFRPPPQALPDPEPKNSGGSSSDWWDLEPHR